MITKTFFRKIEKLGISLNRELDIISKEQLSIVETAEKSLIKIDETIREIKISMTEVVFESVAEEAYFFKNLKPLFISKFIYYSKILSIETSRPNAGQKELRKYYENELSKLKNYYSENRDFYIYYRRNATYLDHKYFVRRSYDLKMELSSDLYNFDENFTSSHDLKIAQIMANEDLEVYILNIISTIGQLSTGNNSSKFPLVWSASKVSLVELLYALHQTRCFNGGNIEFSEVIKATEKLFELDLGNSYKTLGEIKSRKNGRTKFLQLLNDNLNQLFLESDA
ncbi:RteC protein [Chryseobacterium sp. RP-3-3]|uniref:RteC protein n=1 Tax=Chryseobacterium antibioticum TaxID=2728847 RepID=A0A7Y0ANU9_9FLAO|nr:RteC domain-containing protein [Chryseobacterium antibioticum]NML70777.1 RteC protein [Chryseobacterium antibioticum]